MPSKMCHWSNSFSKSVIIQLICKVGIVCAVVFDSAGDYDLITLLGAVVL